MVHETVCMVHETVCMIHDTVCMVHTVSCMGLCMIHTQTRAHSVARRSRATPPPRVRLALHRQQHHRLPRRRRRLPHSSTRRRRGAIEGVALAGSSTPVTPPATPPLPVYAASTAPLRRFYRAGPADHAPCPGAQQHVLRRQPQHLRAPAPPRHSSASFRIIPSQSESRACNPATNGHFSVAWPGPRPSTTAAQSLSRNRYQLLSNCCCISIAFPQAIPWPPLAADVMKPPFPQPPSLTPPYPRRRRRRRRASRLRRIYTLGGPRGRPHTARAASRAWRPRAALDTGPGPDTGPARGGPAQGGAPCRSWRVPVACGARLQTRGPWARAARSCCPWLLPLADRAHVAHQAHVAHLVQHHACLVHL
jgi:hypothetical protein